jgi:Protein of unknown function (DUF3050)
MPVSGPSIADYEPHIAELRRKTEDVRQRVLNHPIYSALTTMDALRTFMESHVFAVWDFMSLLKRLQQQLTCTAVPWLPTSSPTARRLINEIVLAEESDRWAGGVASHFELYLSAMSDAGANTSAVTDFLAVLRAGNDPIHALRAAQAPLAARMFVTRTWGVLIDQPVHCQAAAFAFGREDLIPAMFDQVLKGDEPNTELETFRYYLQRHVEVDSGEHSHMAVAMMAEICGEDREKWDACAAVITSSLEARADLWTRIVESLEPHEPNVHPTRPAAAFLAHAASVSAAIRSFKLAQ